MHRRTLTVPSVSLASREAAVDQVARTPVDSAVLSCILLDPSLFTPPYDAALTRGLVTAGVEPHWATRPVRHGDRQEIPAQYVSTLFYKRVDGTSRLPGALRSMAKGFAHVAGLYRLLKLIRQRNPDVIHVQWVVLPLLDVAALWLIRRRCPIVMTVHDPVPYNGERLSALQNLGFDLPIRLANRVIVHTEAGRHSLMERGIASRKISVVPHGPLTLHTPPRLRTEPRDPRWTFVLFGEIKPYKGLDVLVEALGQVPLDVRRQARVIVAGRPRMDLTAIEHRIAELGLGESVVLRPQRLTDQQMADLFADADCFVFPYRVIDASGVYFLTKPLGKWIIASRVGVFAEDLRQGTHGELLPSEDVEALAAALSDAIVRRPRPLPIAVDDTWDSIGSLTKTIYRQAAAMHG